MEIIDATKKDGNVSFETTHLSSYSVIGYNDLNNPETNDNLYYYIGILLVSITILITTSYKKKYS